MDNMDLVAMGSRRLWEWLDTQPISEVSRRMDEVADLIRGLQALLVSLQGAHREKSRAVNGDPK